MKELIEIQNKLNAPKSQHNKHGSYNYRSCEDILEGLKDLLLENKCFLTLSDEIVEVGGKIYVKATATITNSSPTKETALSVSVSAFAQEALKQGAMGAPQLTGSASSYARKYALNGLFCIDDSKDPDELPPNEQSPQSNNNNNVSNQQKINKANELPWLNKGTPEWNNAVSYIKTNKPMCDMNSLITELLKFNRINPTNTKELRNV